MKNDSHELLNKITKEEPAESSVGFVIIENIWDEPFF